MCRAAPFVDLADVSHGARVDPVLLAGVTADGLEIPLCRELAPLRRRQPLPQEPQRAALRSFFGAVSYEESPDGFFARALPRAKRPESQHGVDRSPAGQPGEEDGFFRVRVE